MLEMCRALSRVRSSMHIQIERSVSCAREGQDTGARSAEQGAAESRLPSALYAVSIYRNYEMGRSFYAAPQSGWVPNLIQRRMCSECSTLRIRSMQLTWRNAT